MRLTATAALRLRVRQRPNGPVSTCVAGRDNSNGSSRRYLAKRRELGNLTEVSAVIRPEMGLNKAI